MSGIYRTTTTYQICCTIYTIFSRLARLGRSPFEVAWLDATRRSRHRHTPCSWKVRGPYNLSYALGIELDSEHMTARLPPDKTEELLVVIRAWAQKKWCTGKELESLVGKLSHACAVVAHGRTFLHRMINLLRDSKPRRRYIRLNKPCQLDSEWWNEFLPLWNGVSFFDLPEWENNRLRTGYRSVG